MMNQSELLPRTEQQVIIRTSGFHSVSVLWGGQTNKGKWPCQNGPFSGPNLDVKLYVRDLEDSLRIGESHGWGSWGLAQPLRSCYHSVRGQRLPSLGLGFFLWKLKWLVYSFPEAVTNCSKLAA